MNIPNRLICCIPSFAAVRGSGPVWDDWGCEVVHDIREDTFVDDSSGEGVFGSIVNIPLEDLLVCRSVMLSEWVMKGRDGGERRYGVRDEEGKFIRAKGTMMGSGHSQSSLFPQNNARDG
jgi:hypothetical protein